MFPDSARDTEILRAFAGTIDNIFIDKGEPVIVINQSAVEKVVRALTEAVSDDPEKLQKLIVVLANHGPHTGLGYILSDATRAVAQKLSESSR